jgi:poly(3-hydroxybutyrate) depolymerase
MPRLSTFATLALLATSQTLAAKVLDKSTTIAGMSLYYKVVLPKDYDPEKAYPAVLAFPPGAQTNDMVMVTLTQNWAAEAQRRGYIVIIPAAPGGRLFFEEGARVFPAFLDQLLREYKIRDNKFHIAGMSNGGLSAFHIAASYPQYFLSVTGFPGYLPDATPQRVAALASLSGGKPCIYMHAGELDTGWLDEMQQQAAAFRAQGMTVRMTVEKGQSHVIRTLTGDGAARLFEEIEEAAHGC